MEQFRRGQGIPRAQRDSGSIGSRTGVTTVGTLGSALGKGQEEGLGSTGKKSGSIHRVWGSSPMCPWGREEGRIQTLPPARNSSGMPQGPGETQSPGTLGADSFPKAGSSCPQMRNPSCSISRGHLMAASGFTNLTVWEAWRAIPKGTPLDFTHSGNVLLSSRQSFSRNLLPPPTTPARPGAPKISSFSPKLRDPIHPPAPGVWSSSG